MDIVDFDNFVVGIKGTKDWWNEFYRLYFKIHDPLGFFGAERFDYFCYGNKKEIVLNGISKTYVLLHTDRSLSRLPGNRYKEVKERMENFGINVDEVISRKEVIYTYDSKGRLMISKSSITIFFPPYSSSNDNSDGEKQPELERKNDDG